MWNNSATRFHPASVLKPRSALAKPEDDCRRYILALSAPTGDSGAADLSRIIRLCRTETRGRRVLPHDVCSGGGSGTKDLCRNMVASRPAGKRGRDRSRCAVLNRGVIVTQPRQTSQRGRRMSAPGSAPALGQEWRLNAMPSRQNVAPKTAAANEGHRGGVKTVLNIPSIAHFIC